MEAPALPAPRGRSRHRAGLAAWLVVVLVGAAVWLVGASQPEARAELVGRVLPVSPTSVDKRNISANNSPSIARNPADPENLAVSGHNRLSSVGPAGTLT